MTEPSSQGRTEERLSTAVPEFPNVAVGPLRAIQTAMNQQHGLKGFLSEAELALIATSDEMTARLGVEAVRIAGNRRATAVDVEDVREADKLLNRQADNGRSAWNLAISGMLVGAAVALLIAVFAPSIATQWALASILIAAVALLVGILLAYLGSPSRLRRSSRKMPRQG